MEDEPEIEFSIEPIAEALSERGISPSEFEEAMVQAFDVVDEKGSGALHCLESAPLTIRGVRYQLADLAQIFVRGELGILRTLFSESGDAR